MINERNVRYYCCEDISYIENYDKAITDRNGVWDCHHRLEVGANGQVISKEELIEHGLYYNRPANELIFLTHNEHARLHNKNKQVSDSTRKKMS